MSIDYQKILLSATDKTITEYSISEGTTEISPSAFINCVQLTNINMEEPLYSNIGSKAFLTNCKVNNENTLLSDSCSDKSFSGRIIIPNDVTSIGYEAFRYCSALTSITIPSCVTSIDWWAFDGCTSLTSVTFKENSRLTLIGQFAFLNCTSLKEVHILDTASWCAINFANPSSNPLYYAENLYLNGELVTNLVIPEGVTSIGSYAFYNYKNLTSVMFKENSQLTSIGDSAFYDCSMLKSIMIPEGVKSIWDNAFYNCSSLTSITIPDNVISIGGWAFYHCSELTSITLPEGLTAIGRQAFEGCSGLTSVTIPEGLTEIGWGLFRSCSNLTSITIPKSVTYIELEAFRDCTNLTNIVLENRTLSEAQSKIGTSNYLGYTGTITYNGGTYDTISLDPAPPPPVPY